MFLFAGTNDSSFVKKLYHGKKIILNGDTLNLSKRLYELVWQPLEPYLANIKTVYYSPAGLLFRFSFAAMQTPDNKYLSDIINLRELSTTASLVRDKDSPEKQIRNITLYGGINYDADTAQILMTAKNFSVPEIVASATHRSFTVTDSSRGSSWFYLEGSMKEANDIQSEFRKNNLSCTLYSGNMAVEESFKALNGSASPDVIHIATHGFFFPSPKDDKRALNRMMFADEKKVFSSSENPSYIFIPPPPPVTLSIE